MSLVAQRPPFTEPDARRVAARRYNLQADCLELDSERDRNFRLEREDGRRFVLKIANRLEDDRFLDLQTTVLERLEHAALPLPRLVRASDGSRTIVVEDSDGERYRAKLLTWIEGSTLASTSPHTPELLESLGRILGRIDGVLQEIDHPASHREFHWDLRRAMEAIRDGHRHITDVRRRRIVDSWAARFESLLPATGNLRTALIHGDANDHNVIVHTAPATAGRIAGLLDLGDMVHSWAVAEPAIAAAYVMLDKRDPLSAACHLLRGFHAEHPLTENEANLLFDLIAMRLCQSVTTAARQRSEAPGNDYLGVSERPAWSLLARLLELHPRLATYRLRAACGFEPCPESPAVVDWIRKHSDRIGPVLGGLDRRTPPPVVDLSVGSTDWAGVAREDTAAWTRAIEDRLAREDATIGIGRYDEPRVCYVSDDYDVIGEERPLRRTIHQGLDLFAAAATPVLVPLDGVVHGLRDNANRLDYGPTVILRHEGPGHPPFHTLYGHLSRGSLDRLAVGQTLRRGEVVGEIGSYPDNGDWPPHLHLQLIVDTLDRDGEFPGVAAPDQREVWKSLCPDPGWILGWTDDHFPERGRSAELLLRQRRRCLGPSLSLSYREPLKIVRGSGAFLYDDQGQAWLDGVNNVCHVGHAHPKVVRAAADQWSVLNTNTRYLHDRLVEYAERLTSKLPDPLSVCYLVCSGSEANELALRLARAHTGGKDVIALDAAYHGNTQALIEVSAYKHAGRGGAGPPSWVHVVPLADPFRGPHKGFEARTGALYAGEIARVCERLRKEDRRLSAFIAESLPSCGGQIVFPPSYLGEAYGHVRRAGGVCIADEVQVGFGRVGSRFWGFELQEVVPDIVTMGKPIGNGHPLAAVVTTPEIAASFANGMEYFNTFGGNPVSCAVGLAVLEIVEQEGLQQRAREVGRQLLGQLKELQERQRLIGDVRGAGLFLGIELVLDRETLEPAPAHAAWLVERMKAHGVLLSTDGPLANVIKIKPPLVFGRAHADRLVETIDKLLTEDALRLEASDRRRA